MSGVLGRWSGKLPRADREALEAVLSLAGRSGAVDVDFGCLYPERAFKQRSWWCLAVYRGAKLLCDGKSSAAEACDGLAQRILDGGECRGCLKVSFVHNEAGYRVDRERHERVVREGVCRWRRERTVWARECGSAPEGSSREKLAQAMAACAVIDAGQIGAARAGRYDDFMSDHPFPEMLLLAELRQYGDAVAELVAAVKDGEFDATAEEGQAWAESADGRAAFAELFPGRAGSEGSGKRKGRRE